MQKEKRKSEKEWIAHLTFARYLVEMLKNEKESYTG